VNGLVAAEWLKLRTTRLLLGTVPAAVVLSFAAVAGVVLSADGVGELESAELVRRLLSVTGTGAILMLVVGILIAVGEYRHGTASDTFLTTPRRDLVLVAKLIVGGAIGLAAGVLSAVLCVGLAVVLYATRNASFPIGDGDVWLTLAGTLTYSTLFAIVGVGFGWLLRNQVLAVAGALAWLAIIEHTLVNLAPTLGRWLPAAAGQAIVRTPLDGLLSPVAGAAVLAAYGAAFAAAGVRISASRDA